MIADNSMSKSWHWVAFDGWRPRRSWVDPSFAARRRWISTTSAARSVVAFEGDLAWSALFAEKATSGTAAAGMAATGAFSWSAVETSHAYSCIARVSGGNPAQSGSARSFWVGTKPDAPGCRPLRHSSGRSTAHRRLPAPAAVRDSAP